MRLQPLGPDGIQRRLTEIQQRLSERNAPAMSPEGAADFPGTLVGSIGSGTGELRPLNPFGEGTSVEPRQTPTSLSPLIQRAATQAGVDPSLFDALVAAESAYDPNARSRAGALGLSQLMPDTARSLGVENPLDPWQNLQGGAAYLSQMLKRFEGDPRLALAAYNAGPGAVERFGGIPPYDETKRYVERVMGLFEARRNG